MDQFHDALAAIRIHIGHFIVFRYLVRAQYGMNLAQIEMVDQRRWRLDLLSFDHNRSV